MFMGFFCVVVYDIFSYMNYTPLRFYCAYDSSSQYISYNYPNIMLTYTRYISIMHVIAS